MTKSKSSLLDIKDPINKKERPRKKIKFFATLAKIFAQRIDLKIAIKITLTALISLFICLSLDTYLSDFHYPSATVWCVVASIIVLQSNIGGTYKAIWNRFLGVLVGSCIGAFFVFNFSARIEIIGLAIFTTIIICSLIGIPDSYRMASLSVVIIMIPWKQNPTADPLSFAFFRFLDTCLGFVVAIFMSHLLWPSQALTKMRLNMADLFSLFRQFFEHLLIPADAWNKSHKILETLQDEIEESFLKSRTVLDESKIELLMRFAPAGVWLDLMNCQEQLWRHFFTLKSLLNSEMEEVFDEQLKMQIKLIVEGIEVALKELSLKLKTEKSAFNFDHLNDLQTALQSDLVRFRSTHRMRKYSLDLVENYFVFFYQIKQIVQLIYRFNQLLDQLDVNKKNNALED